MLAGLLLELMRGGTMATVVVVVAGTKADATWLFRETSDISMDNRSTRNFLIVVLITANVL